MLSAITEDGKKVYAYEVKKTDEKGERIKYYCPECGDDLILKQGALRIWHFAHKHENRMCILRKRYINETKNHKLMKKIIKEIVERDNDCIVSELEHKIGSRIADYYFEVKKFNNIKRVAVECVEKHTDIVDFVAKNVDYVDAGVYVIWLFNLDQFVDKNNRFLHQIRPIQIIKDSHTMNYGKVYAIDIDNKYIYGIHLGKIILGHYPDGQPRYMSAKSINPMLIKRFEIKTFNKRQKDEYLHYPSNPANIRRNNWW